MLPCPGRLAPEVQYPTLALCKWTPSYNKEIMVEDVTSIS